MDIEEINDNSLVKTIFYINGKSQDKLIDELEYFNIVFAKNGIFEVVKNSLYIYFQKTNIKYTNSKLEYIDDDLFIQLIQKPDIEVLYKIIDIFTYIKDKTKYELMVNLYYDIKEKDFIIDIVEQKITSGSIQYIYNEFYENDSRYVRYLQIHSHHSMKAFFSKTDDEDEQNKCHSYFGVIGELINKTSFTQKYRIYCGDKFIPVSNSDVFKSIDYQYNLEQNVQDCLDKIIEENKKIQHPESTIDIVKKDFDSFGNIFKKFNSYGYDNVI